MVGFIGALSTSLCILILVFITLLISYIDSLLPSVSMFQLSDTTNRLPIKTYFIGDGFQPEIEKALQKIKIQSDYVPKLIKVGCTFGFDMTNEIALNIMTYNSIKLNNFALTPEIKMEKTPLLNDQQLNYCYLNFEK